MTLLSSLAASLQTAAEKVSHMDVASKQKGGELKTKANELASHERVQNIKSNASKMGKDALNYAKENPAEVLLGLMALMVYDATETLEDIEAHEEIESAVAVAEYLDR